MFLEREPQNAYDRRAIRIAVCQSEWDLNIHGQEFKSNHLPRDKTANEQKANGKDHEFKLYIGYVPKDLSWNLSTLIDNDHIFQHQVVDYGDVNGNQKGETTQSFVWVLLNLQDNVLRDHRMVT